MLHTSNKPQKKYRSRYRQLDATEEFFKCSQQAPLFAKTNEYINTNMLDSPMTKKLSASDEQRDPMTLFFNSNNVSAESGSCYLFPSCLLVAIEVLWFEWFPIAVAAHPSSSLKKSKLSCFCPFNLSFGLDRFFMSTFTYGTYG